MPKFVTTANFGVGKTGLSTVGYAIYQENGTVKAARTTSGVAELAAGSGIYRASINYDPFFRGYVLWDTGDATIRYSSESINPIDADSMADEVRTMLRSLNTSLSSHLERLFGGARFERLDEIKTVITAEFEAARNQLAGAQNEIAVKISSLPAPVAPADYTKAFNVIELRLAELVKKVNGDIANSNSIRSDIRSLREFVRINNEAVRKESTSAIADKIFHAHSELAALIVEHVKAMIESAVEKIEARSGKLSKEAQAELKRAIAELRGNMNSEKQNIPGQDNWEEILMQTLAR